MELFVCACSIHEKAGNKTPSPKNKSFSYDKNILSNIHLTDSSGKKIYINLHFLNSNCTFEFATKIA
jgi:hypothetical protein